MGVQPNTEVEQSIRSSQNCKHFKRYKVTNCKKKSWQTRQRRGLNDYLNVELMKTHIEETGLSIGRNNKNNSR